MLIQSLLGTILADGSRYRGRRRGGILGPAAAATVSPAALAGPAGSGPIPHQLLRDGRVKLGVGWGDVQWRDWPGVTGSVGQGYAAKTPSWQPRQRNQNKSENRRFIQ